MIKVENVSKNFKNLELFNDVNLEIKPGLITALSGRNGSGKSVFLKMLIGYSQPETGSVMVDEGQVGKHFDFLPHSGISVNAPEFMNTLSGRDNLQILIDINKVVTESELNDLIDYFDMRDNIDKKYKTYSMGMRQKLRIIQAIMEKPKYLILDEPFDGLDQESADKLFKFLKDYINPERYIMITSHDSEMLAQADTIYKVNMETKNIDFIR